MKIEIDLKDILQDEFGSIESLGESIQRQVVDALKSKLQKGVKEQIDLEVSRVIREQLEQAVKVQMPTLVNDLLNSEYVKVDKWGDRCKAPTTFRKELVSAISKELIYAKKPYRSDQSIFTNAVDEIIKEKVDEFKKEYNRLVDELFCKECFDYAVSRLKQKLGIK